MESPDPDIELVNVAIPPLENPYSYTIPKEIERHIDIGSRVEVPLGRRKTTGYVISRSTVRDALARIDIKNGEKLPKFKPVEASSLCDSCFSEEHLHFFQWVADYYQAPLAKVIDLAVPAGAPPQKKKTIFLRDEYEKASLKGSKQKEILSFLEAEQGKIDYALLIKHFQGCYSTLKSLEKKKLIQIVEEHVLEDSIHLRTAPEWAPTEVNLNEDQRHAVQAVCSSIEEQTFHPYLLHGVTGSGKTEVYIEIILTALARGQSALIVVPEIALTPQLVDRFVARLGNTVAVLHSAMNKRERWQSWRLLREGKRKVAIGARSAVFAPIQNPGVIIVDEEHDGSFKQSEGFRYHGRDCAIVRARLSSCPVILGSATPSLESVHNARQRKYTELRLHKRHALHEQLNNIEIIDLNARRPWEMKSRSISETLHDAIEDTLEEDGQVFLLYNRRGFASFFQCERCEEVLRCPNCAVSLTYHQHTNALCCHYCSHSLPPPQYCPICAKETPDNPPALVQRGSGTEKIEEEIEELFEHARVARLDRDTVNKIEDYQQLLNGIRSKQFNIVVGTQMIAKGHDLPEVTLVGIIDCDVGLHMPDFRAGERVFQLLTQAGGRAGRGKKAGRVLLQTRVPHHPALKRTLDQDFDGFATEELGTREIFSYPPFTRLLRILVTSPIQHEPEQLLSAFRRTLDTALEERDMDVQVLGPVAAPFEKLRARWRWHILIKAKKVRDLHQIMRLAKLSMPSGQKPFRLILDLDPGDLL